MKKLVCLVLFLAVLAGVAVANLGERRVYPLRPGIKYLFTGSRDPNNFWDDVNDVYILNGLLEVLDINVTGDFDVNDMNVAGDLTLEPLTASRLLYLDADSNVASVTDFTAWIAGTANQITVTDDTDGTVTLSLPQDYDTGATPTLGGLTITGNSVFGLNSSVFQPTTDTTTFFQVLDADGGTPVLNVDSTNERVGIGTAIPGDTGAAKLQIEGADSSAAGPHIIFETAADTYPLMQIFNYTHDSVSLVFDAYWDGAWKSSDVGSNFRFHKNSDLLKFKYDSGIAQGGAVTWYNAMVIDLTDGDVGIGTISPNAHFQNVGDTHLGADITHYTEFNNRGTMEMHGDARVKESIDLNMDDLSKGNTAPTVTILGNYIGWSYDVGDDSLFTFEIPHEWASGTNLIIYAHWYINEAYTADKEVKWQALWSATPDNETEAVDAPTHSGTLTSTTQNIPATAKYLTSTVVDSTGIPGASLSVDDEIGITFSRIAADNDDPTADPVVTHVHIEYTKNKLGGSLSLPENVIYAGENVIYAGEQVEYN